MRSKLISLAAWLLLASQSFAGITYSGTTGQTLYARVQTGTSTFVACALTEGSSGGLGIYNATDAALVSAGLTTANRYPGYPFTIRSGSPSTTASDTIVATSATNLGWNGSCEVPLTNKPITWFVASTGNDSNTGQSAAAPLLTLSEAFNTRYQKGDTVRVLDQITIGGAIGVPSGATLEGLGSDVSKLIDTTVGNSISVGRNCLVKGLWLKCQPTSGVDTGEGAAPIAGIGNDTVFEACRIDGNHHAVYASGASDIRFVRCQLTGVADCCSFADCDNIVFDQSTIKVTTAGWDNGAVQHGLNLYGSRVLLTNNSKVYVAVSTTTKGLAGVGLYVGGTSDLFNGSRITLQNGSWISVQQTNGSATSFARGITHSDSIDSSTAAHAVAIDGGSGIITSGGTDHYHVYLSGSSVANSDVRIGRAGVNASLVSVNGTLHFADDAETNIKTKTDYLPSATAGASGGLFIAGSNAATTVNITGNVTGNLSGSVGSVTGAVGSVTGNVGGNVVGSVASIASGGISSASFASGAITASALATDSITAAKVAHDAAVEIGAEASGSSGGPFLQRKIATARVLQAKVVSGVATTIGRVRMKKGTGPLTWAVELAGTELAPGDFVDSMSAPTATGTGVTVGSTAGTTYGTNNSRLLFEVTAASNATVGDSTITIAFGPNAGESQTITVPVTISE